jgi:hypothetical protein
MTAPVGDEFTFLATKEIVKIVERRSLTRWVVERGISGNVFPTSAHGEGDRLSANCNAAYQGLYWKFLEDPFGRNIIVRAGDVGRGADGGRRRAPDQG